MLQFPHLEGGSGSHELLSHVLRVCLVFSLKNNNSISIPWMLCDTYYCLTPQRQSCPHSTTELRLRGVKQFSEIMRLERGTSRLDPEAPDFRVQILHCKLVLPPACRSSSCKCIVLGFVMLMLNETPVYEIILYLGSRWAAF